MRTSETPSSGLAGLRRFLAPVTRSAPEEVCELCARPLDAAHAHVVDVETRRMRCACRPCTLLFTHSGAEPGRYRAVPDRHLHDPSCRLTAADWDDTEIPVRTAFFFRNAALDRWAAFYPGPAGATESLLSPASWERLVASTPLFGMLAPDVEAVLVHGPRGTAALDAFLVPIDACYELVGVVRRSWRGFDGGSDAWRAIDAFFARIRGRSRAIATAVRR